MEKRVLEGYHSEETLQEMLHKGEIDHLTYKDEKAAQQFVEYQLNKEVEMHTDLLD